MATKRTRRNGPTGKEWAAAEEAAEHQASALLEAVSGMVGLRDWLAGLAQVHAGTPLGEEAAAHEARVRAAIVIADE